MTPSDIVGVRAVVEAASEQLERRAGCEPRPRTDNQRERFLRGLTRFVELDRDGAWVAADDDHVVGMAACIRRGLFWGLSMLFVDPARQNQGLGRQLRDGALATAPAAEVRMILSSSDPRALRRYGQAGLAMHPAVEARGRIDQTAIPDGLPAQAAEASVPEFVASVDAGLRGSRADDVAYLLSEDSIMHIIDRGAARGHVVHRRERLLMCLAGLLLASLPAREAEVSAQTMIRLPLYAPPRMRETPTTASFRTTPA
jgi:predicted N-acetyltransferase YhbS